MVSKTIIEGSIPSAPAKRNLIRSIRFRFFYLKMGAVMRININYVLDSAFAKECILLNQHICKTISNCEIDFSTREYRPHITLFMGEVDDNNFEYVFKKVTQIVSRLKFSAIE